MWACICKLSHTSPMIVKQTSKSHRTPYNFAAKFVTICKVPNVWSMTIPQIYKKTQKLLIQIQNCDEKTMVGQNFKLQIVRPPRLIEFPESSCMQMNVQNHWPRSLQKLAVPLWFVVFLRKMQQKSYTQVPPKIQKVLILAPSRLLSLFHTFSTKKLQNDIRISDLLYVFWYILERSKTAKPPIGYTKKYE